MDDTAELAAQVIAEIPDADSIAASLIEMLEREHTGARVRFGPGPTDNMPAEWASRGLTWLRGAHPDAFMKMMRHVMGVGSPASHKAGGNGQ